MKENTNKFEYIKIKAFCKATPQKEKQAADGEKIFVIQIIGRGLVSKYKEDLL